MFGEQSIKTQIERFIQDKFNVSESRRLTADTGLLDAGIVDSIGILEIVSFLEESFAISVRDEDLLPENFGSIASITAFVERKLGDPALQKS